MKRWLALLGSQCSLMEWACSILHN
jgi:hypothetical protein